MPSWFVSNVLNAYIIVFLFIGADVVDVVGVDDDVVVTLVGSLDCVCANEQCNISINVNIVNIFIFE